MPRRGQDAIKKGEIPKGVASTGFPRTRIEVGYSPSQENCQIRESTSKREGYISGKLKKMRNRE